MSDNPEILVLDDGELDDLVSVLEGLGVAFRRLRGGEIGENLAPPLELLVTTPRRVDAVQPGSPEGARPARPVRIISSQEDSNPMREMLRRRGFDLLVRRPTHPEVWRLLVRRALYQGGERRTAARVPVAFEVTVQAEGPCGPRSVLLVELSSRACRILSREAFEAGDRVRIELPATPGGGEALRLDGEVLRTELQPAPQGEALHLAAVLFEAELGEDGLAQLDGRLAAWSAERESQASSGGGDSSEADERRHHARGSFEDKVSADRSGETFVLMGRDLSAGGMRVERLPDLSVGDRFELSIYAPGSHAPLQLLARVIRDDGEQGFALAFDDTPRGVARALEKLVACLPDVEPLQAPEADGLGAVISELKPVAGQSG